MILKLGFVGLCLMTGANVLAQPQYADQSDTQLTELTAQWEQLSTEERRALLTEVKSRMSAQRKQGITPVLRIRTQRRFGRTVRQPDGSLVHIETTHQRVVYRSLRSPAQIDAEHAFGRGFEQRMADAETGKPGEIPTSTQEKPPVLRVTHPYRQ